YTVVFADKKLDISGERLFSTTARADVRRASGVFTDLMRPMIIVMSAASALIFLVVLFLMMKMMLDRSSFHISMLRVFGFRNREVRKMYLDGNFIVVALGALAAIPLTKLIMNGIFPKYLVANVSIAFEPAFPWYYSPVMYGLILMMYLLISLLLMRNIRKITPAEVLKNRE
ncbi:MAG: ABC transporter permease, partial [Firmicutes bacterium]|nr:ABC transporter permease [Bacillota bacterium]